MGFIPIKLRGWTGSFPGFPLALNFCDLPMDAISYALHNISLPAVLLSMQTVSYLYPSLLLVLRSLLAQVIQPYLLVFNCLCLLEPIFESTYGNSLIFSSSLYIHQRTELIAFIKLVEEKFIHWQMLQTQSGISKQVHILLSFSLRYFMMNIGFICHSFDFTPLLSCSCRVLILMARRLAAIRNVMASCHHSVES